MIDIEKTVNAVIKLCPDKDENFIRDWLPLAIRKVSNAEIEPGDFYFTATGGLHVQRIHYVEDGLDDVEVFVQASVHSWEDE